jgi:hypothetical protein
MAYPPKIYGPGVTGMTFQNLFGALGAERSVTGHYTAGPRDRSDQHALQLCRQYHQAHKAKGWGGMGYHYCITRKGNIVLLRPLHLKGAHTGGHNTGNVGVMMHGTTGDKPTTAQRRAYRWLLANAHTKRMPRTHRTDHDLRGARRMGHNSWPGHQTNGCPGSFKPLYLRGK